MRVVRIHFTFFQRFNRVGLSRQSQDALPGATVGIHVAWRRANQFGDGQKHHAVVAQADRETRVTCHGTVHGVLRQLHAVKGIGSVGRDGANRVGRINVLASGDFAVLSEMLGNGVFHELTNCGEFLVATGVLFGRGSQQFFSSTLFK